MLKKRISEREKSTLNKTPYSYHHITALISLTHFLLPPTRGFIRQDFKYSTYLSSETKSLRINDYGDKESITIEFCGGFSHPQE